MIIERIMQYTTDLSANFYMSIISTVAGGTYARSVSKLPRGTIIGDVIKRIYLLIEWRCICSCSLIEIQRLKSDDPCNVKVEIKEQTYSNS